MNETVFSIGEFPEHKVLAEILDEGPMPDKPGMAGAHGQDPLAKYLRTVELILKYSGYPTTSMELDALIDTDKDSDPDEFAMTFTILLRLAHRTRSAWEKGELSRFGYYMGQLSKVTAEAKYYEKLPYTISGLKSYIGGKKGAAESAKTKAAKSNRQEIRRHCKTLLAAGYSKRELSGMAHKKYSKREGFPSSVRQYRNIVKSLK